MKTIRKMKFGFAFSVFALGLALSPSVSAQAADLLVHLDFADGSLKNKGTINATAQINSGTQTTPTITEYAPGSYAYDATGANAMGNAGGSNNGRRDGSLSLNVGNGLAGLQSYTITGWYKLEGGVTVSSEAYLVEAIGQSSMRVNTNNRSQLYTHYESKDTDGNVIASGNVFQSSLANEPVMNAQDQWVFFSSSYDSITGIIQFSLGFDPDSLQVTTRSSETDIRLLPDGAHIADGNGIIVIGNRGTADGMYLTDNRPFKGMMKDIRIYGSTVDGSGALDIDFIKSQVMVQGVIPEASTYALILGGASAAMLVAARLRRRK